MDTFDFFEDFEEDESFLDPESDEEEIQPLELIKLVNFDEIINIGEGENGNLYTVELIAKITIDLNYNFLTKKRKIRKKIKMRIEEEAGFNPKVNGYFEKNSKILETEKVIGKNKINTYSQYDILLLHLETFLALDEQAIAKEYSNRNIDMMDDAELNKYIDRQVLLKRISQKQGIEISELRTSGYSGKLLKRLNWI